MGEKRRLRRKHLIYYLRVYDRKNHELVGQLVDITIEGLKLTSEQPIALNKKFGLRMVLPDTIEGSKIAAFDAVSMWCKKDVNPKYYVVGLQFESISKRDLKRIENLIYEFSFQN